MLVSSFLGRTFRAFRHRDFRLMWLGACASTIGTFVQQFAQSWLVYDLTKDPFYLGLDLFLGQLPIILLSLVGGVFADRMDRRKMLLGSQYIQMICAFVLAALFFTHRVRIWEILSLSFIVGLGQSFGGPAYSALLPTLVPAEDLANAIAMNSIQFNLARVLGPAIGGLAYATLGATWCFALEWSVLSCSDRIPHDDSGKVRSAEIERSHPEEHESGDRLHTRARRSLGARLAGFLYNLARLFAHGFFTGDRSNRPSWRDSDLSITPHEFGSRRHRRRAYRRRFRKAERTWLCGAMDAAGLGAAMAGFALSRWLLSFLPSDLPQWRRPHGVGVVDGVACAAIVPDQMRGRVMSVYNLAFRLGIPVGGLALGKLIPLLGVSTALAGSGLGLIGIVLYFVAAMRGSAVFQRAITGVDQTTL